jgi:hypothetical protein
VTERPETTTASPPAQTQGNEQITPGTTPYGLTSLNTPIDTKSPYKAREVDKREKKNEEKLINPYRTGAEEPIAKMITYCVSC